MHTGWEERTDGVQGRCEGWCATSLRVEFSTEFSMLHHTFYWNRCSIHYIEFQFVKQSPWGKYKGVPTKSGQLAPERRESHMYHMNTILGLDD
jgi:hypothetical protein